MSQSFRLENVGLINRYGYISLVVYRNIALTYETQK